MTPHALRSSGVKTRQMIIGNELVPVASLVELRLKNKSEVAELSHSIPRSHQKYENFVAFLCFVRENTLYEKFDFHQVGEVFEGQFCISTRTFLHQAPRPDPLLSKT